MRLAQQVKDFLAALVRRASPRADFRRRPQVFEGGL